MSLSTRAATSEPLVRFARKISHDLNNFSTVVRTYSELLLSDLPADSGTYADVAEIQRAAENMVQYLQRVTRFARAGSMKRMSVDVDAVARETGEQFRTMAPTRLLDVRASSGSSVLADAIWLRDVLIELLQNAHDVSPAGATVLLEVTREHNQVIIAVIDHGPGFSAEMADQAGEPLVTGKAGVRGAGMGLAIVSAFVGVLGGTLDEARVGERTVVTLRLPVG